MLFKCYYAVLYLFWIIFYWLVLTASIVLYGIWNSMSCMQYFKQPFAVYDSRKVWTPLHLHNPNWGYILIAHTRCPRVFANSRVLQNITPKTCTFCNYFAQILSHPISICSLNFGYKKNLVLFPTLKKDEHGVSKVSTNLSKTILEVFKWPCIAARWRV